MTAHLSRAREQHLRGIYKAGQAIDAARKAFSPADKAYMKKLRAATKSARYFKCKGTKGRGISPGEYGLSDAHSESGPGMVYARPIPRVGDDHAAVPGHFQVAE